MTPDELNMLDELLAYDGGRLSGWAIDFIESLDRRRDDGRPLSARQSDKLREIWDQALG